MKALIWLLLLLATGEAIVLWVLLYNNLVALRNECDRAWGNIDVLLKQRSDEVPNLVRVCQAYMSHERQTLEAVTAARQAALRASGPAETGSAEQRVNEALGRLFAAVEAYPELRANENFLALQKRITGLEGEIADRREYFNSAVTNYNIRIDRLPDGIVAGWLGYHRRSTLKFGGLDRSTPPAVAPPSVKRTAA